MSEYQNGKLDCLNMLAYAELYVSHRTCFEMIMVFLIYEFQKKAIKNMAKKFNELTFLKKIEKKQMVDHLAKLFGRKNICKTC